MPIYPFECECGYVQEICAPFQDAPALGATMPCPACDGYAVRTLNVPHLALGEADPDYIPPSSRVSRSLLGISPRKAKRIADAYERDRAQKKELIKSGGNRGSVRMTHSIPEHLFHGKIKQTGDKHYWDDPGNRAKHKGTQL